MLEEDLEPENKKADKKNLEKMSVEELEEYIEELKDEISRVEAEVSRKKAHIEAASSFFKS
jgi:uncharacterized small protein (DUF1192 family)